MFSAIIDRDFVANLVRLAGESAHADGASLYTIDQTRRFLKPFVVHNLPHSYIDGIGWVEIGTQCCGRAVQMKKPWVVRDMLSDPLFKDGLKGAQNCDIRAGFSVPVITHDGNAVGSLACHFRRPYAPTNRDLEKNQTFAALIAHALEYPTAERDGWRELFEAVLRERDPDVLPTRIERARTAIYDHLELARFGSIPIDEDGLTHALRALREIERSPQNLWLRNKGGDS
jgi:GAF domain-containing protein